MVLYGLFVLKIFNLKLFTMKNNLLFVAMVFIVSTMSLLIGCQNDETSTTEQTQQIDPQVLKLSSDPIVQKELMFMKEKMGYNLSKIYVLKGELSGDYGTVQGWEAIMIPGKYVRDAMKRAEKQLKPEANVRHKVLSLFWL